MTSSYKAAFIYSPYIECKHTKHYQSDVPCPHILLPFGGLQAKEWDEAILEEGQHPPEWPSDDWKAWFGCSTCGFLSEYSYKDVRWDIVPKSAPGQFHSGANCFCIEFECGQKNCKSPTKLHAEKSGLTETAVLGLIRSPFFIGTLPCGHPVLSLPANQYRIYKVGTFN